MFSFETHNTLSPNYNAPLPRSALHSKFSRFQNHSSPKVEFLFPFSSIQLFSYTVKVILLELIYASPLSFPPMVCIALNK